MIFFHVNPQFFHLDPLPPWFFNRWRSTPPPPPPHVHSNGIALNAYQTFERWTRWLQLPVTPVWSTRFESFNGRHVVSSLSPFHTNWRRLAMHWRPTILDTSPMHRQTSSVHCHYIVSGFDSFQNLNTKMLNTILVLHFYHKVYCLLFGKRKSTSVLSCICVCQSVLGVLSNHHFPLIDITVICVNLACDISWPDRFGNKCRTFKVLSEVYLCHV